MSNPNPYPRSRLYREAYKKTIRYQQRILGIRYRKLAAPLVAAMLPVMEKAIRALERR